MNIKFSGLMQKQTVKTLELTVTWHHVWLKRNWCILLIKILTALMLSLSEFQMC